MAKILFAGVPGGPEKHEIRLEYGSGRRLYSFFDIYDGGRLSTIRGEIMKNKVDLFLDSGAFSAWTQGAEIDIQEYIKFIKNHLDVINVYANLDVIGVGGKQPNRLTAEKTLENQRIMEDAGLTPIPVFHYGEPEEDFLKYYVDNYDYIAIGVAGNTGDKLKPWLDRCFGNYICKSNGMPKTKVHGFAVTSLRIMLRYPWYSVDSTSWVVTGRMGSIYVPRQRDGKWVYDEDSWKIAVSSRSPASKEAGKHINTLPPKQKQLVLDYIHYKGYQLGKSSFKTVSADYELKENERWASKKPKDKTAKREVEVIEEPGICNKYQLRDEMNIIYFQDLERSMSEWPWPFKKKNKIQGFGL